MAFGDTGGKFGRPSSVDVRDFHVFDDLDVSPDSHHHSLGAGPNQAASGAHTHDGSNSVRLLEGFVITGGRAGNTAVASIIAALVSLGATDSTTA